MKLITRISAVCFSWLFFYHAWKAPVVYVNVREQQERGLWLYFKESYNYLRKRFCVVVFFLEASLEYSIAASVAMSQLLRRSWAQDTVCLECYVFSLYLFGFSTGSAVFFCLYCRWIVDSKLPLSMHSCVNVWFWGTLRWTGIPSILIRIQCLLKKNRLLQLSCRINLWKWIVEFYIQVCFTSFLLILGGNCFPKCLTFFNMINIFLYSDLMIHAAYNFWFWYVFLAFFFFLHGDKGQPNLV